MESCTIPTRRTISYKESPPSRVLGVSCVFARHKMNWRCGSLPRSKACPYPCTTWPFELVSILTHGSVIARPKRLLDSCFCVSSRMFPGKLQPGFSSNVCHEFGDSLALSGISSAANLSFVMLVPVMREMRIWMEGRRERWEKSLEILACDLAGLIDVGLSTRNSVHA